MRQSPRPESEAGRTGARDRAAGGMDQRRSFMPLAGAIAVVFARRKRMSGFASDLQAYLSAGSLMAYPVAFVAGLLISFTPCVYPVILIQLGFIGGQTASAQASGVRARWRGFTLSVLFVTGMAVVYAALGAFASLTGSLFGIWASSPWTYAVVGNVILLMALSTLDVIQLPAPRFQ